MFRLIFSAQAIVYLVLMPAIHSYMDAFYRPPLLVSAIAVVFLMAGFAAFKISHPAQSAAMNSLETTSIAWLRPRDSVPFAFAILVALYSYVSWSNGLWNRRQGSEVMADIYGNLPLLELAILRVYEIAFMPIAVVYFFGTASRAHRIFVISLLIVSLPLMGIEDSRGRILAIAVSILLFVNLKSFRYFIENNYQILILILSAIVVFIYASTERAAKYARTADYFFYEIVLRLDGLNLVSELRSYSFINYFGSFDLAMLAPLVSRIPLIEAGRLAKLEGITSTKQYFLKSLLNTDRIDNSNSILLDPLYFGGVMGMIIAFATLGYFIASFDCYVAQGRLFYSRVRLALAFAFVASFGIIEVDYFGTLTSLVQSFVIVFPMMVMVLREPDYSSNLRTAQAHANASDGKLSSR